MKNPLNFFKKRQNNRSDSDETSQSEEMRFGDRVKQFFNPEPQKEKVLRHEDFNAAGDVYYASVSAGYKIAQRVLCLCIVVFLVFSIISNFREITFDNFFFLIRDFTSAVDAESNAYETLSYESDSRQNFVMYRGGIATVSPSKISIFTATGRRTLNSTSSYSSPHLISSNKYVLVYDTSGTTFSIYNSFSRVYTETLDYPITDACFGEDGSFVIVTRTADSRSVIRKYNRQFEIAIELNADHYVFDIALNQQRNQLAILSYELGDGTGRAVLSVRDAKTFKETEKLYYDGEFPIACGFLEADRFAVITNRYVRVMEQDFSIHDISNDYSAGNITGYHLSAEGASVSATISSQNYVVAFDKKGTLLYNGSVSFTVSDVSVCDGYVFMQTEQGVARMNPKKEETLVLNAGHGKMLIYNASTALVCGESKAVYLVFND